jgi:hypothetical protein
MHEVTEGEVVVAEVEDSMGVDLEDLAEDLATVFLALGI